jgi:hypothetical protein
MTSPEDRAGRITLGNRTVAVAVPPFQIRNSGDIKRLPAAATLFSVL